MEKNESNKFQIYVGKASTQWGDNDKELIQGVYKLIYQPFGKLVIASKEAKKLYASSGLSLFVYCMCLLLNHSQPLNGLSYNVVNLHTTSSCWSLTLCTTNK